jgi:hypothetical protein
VPGTACPLWGEGEGGGAGPFAWIELLLPAIASASMLLANPRRPLLQHRNTSSGTVLSISNPVRGGEPPSPLTVSTTTAPRRPHAAPYARTSMPHGWRAWDRRPDEEPRTTTHYQQHLCQLSNIEPAEGMQGTRALYRRGGGGGTGNAHLLLLPALSHSSLSADRCRRGAAGKKITRK